MFLLTGDDESSCSSEPDDSVLEETRDVEEHEAETVDHVITVEEVVRCQRVYFDVETTGLGMYESLMVES